MIDYDESVWLSTLLFKWEGSIFPQAAICAIPGALVSLSLLLARELQGPDPQPFAGFEKTVHPGMLTSFLTVLVFLLGFRTNQALQRFWSGSSLLHQMRGEWQDSVSCLMTFSRKSKHRMPDEVNRFRHTLVRLMSLCHGMALQEIKNCKETEHFEVLDMSGLSKETLSYLQECKDTYSFNRIEVLLHMIQVLTTQAFEDKILDIPPPILSRVYQTLSRGLVKLIDAKKIADTRFPFPYAQLISLFLVANTCITPLYMCLIFAHWIVTPIATFFLLFGVFSLNLVAIELEMPFGDDANDLPLGRFQSDMNTTLMMLLCPKSDVLPSTSLNCISDFSVLKHHIHSDWQTTRRCTGRLTRQIGKEVDGCMFKHALEKCGGSSPRIETKVEMKMKESLEYVQDPPTFELALPPKPESAPLPPLALETIPLAAEEEERGSAVESKDEDVVALHRHNVELGRSLDQRLSDFEGHFQRWSKTVAEQIEAFDRNSEMLHRFTSALTTNMAALLTKGMDRKDHCSCCSSCPPTCSQASGGRCFDHGVACTNFSRREETQPWSFAAGSSGCQQPSPRWRSRREDDSASLWAVREGTSEVVIEPLSVPPRVPSIGLQDSSPQTTQHLISQI